MSGSCDECNEHALECACTSSGGFMPTYDYNCPSCKYSMQYMHSIIDHTIKKCPECSCHMVKGIGGGIAVHFKGSGFYETDYKIKDASRFSNVKSV